MVDVITENLDLWSSAMINKSTAGRGTSNKQTAYGIKKLRELILELAVRGKLMPQDPNDEPAGVLLKKIDEEKRNLLESGEIKKQFSSSEIEDYEIPFFLPKGWEWSRIGNIGRDWGQKTPISDFTYIDVSSIINILGLITNPEIISASNAPSRARKIVKIGTVIYSTVRPYLKNICVIENEYLPEPIASTAFAILHPLQNMPGRFFAMYFRSPTFVAYVESVQNGIAYPAINDKQFFNGLVPIPPLNEQHRIVAKVDELMALCDQLEQQQTDSIAAHKTLVQTLLGTLTQAADAAEFEQAWSRIANHFDALFTTESSIDQLKQTLLQLAVMGKLVPHDPNDEPASILLEKIAEEHGKTGKGRTAKNKPELDLSQKVILPSSWEVALFQDITKVITCGMASTPKYYDSGRIFLSAKNVKPYRFMPDDHKFVDEETYRKITQNAKPEKGDILLTRVGAGIGEAALIDQDIDFAYYVSLTLIKPYLQYLNSTYLLHWLNSPEGVKKSLDNIYGTGMSQGNLNVNQVRMFSIPIPPLNEQHRIVAKVDELMALCDSLKARIAAAQTTQLQLADVIVEQAVA